MKWVVASVALALISCDEPRGKRGLPPADEWQAPRASSSEVSGDDNSAWRGADPHAGMDMGGADPHAGMDMGGADPHAGVDMGTGMGGADPHAGMDMGGADPHAGVDMGMGGADPMMNLEPPDPNREIDPSKFVAGRVTLGPKLGAVTPPVILFLSVRPINAATGDVIGSPLAVERLDVKEFPVSFHLSGAQSMVANTVFDGSVEIYARIDGDGEARTVEPGDIEGSVRAEVPAKGLSLELTSRLR